MSRASLAARLRLSSTSLIVVIDLGKPTAAVVGCCRGRAQPTTRSGQITPITGRRGVVPPVQGLLLSGSSRPPIRMPIDPSLDPRSLPYTPSGQFRLGSREV